MQEVGIPITVALGVGWFLFIILKFILAQWHDTGAMDRDLPKKYQKVVGQDPLFSKATYTKINYK